MLVTTAFPAYPFALSEALVLAFFAGIFALTVGTEGKLGTMRWLSRLLGIAGTYRKNDQVDFVYTSGGRRLVAHGVPRPGGL